MIVAIKYNEDNFYSNETYAKLGGIPKSEMAFLEDLVKARYNALDYLLYGRFMGLLEFGSEEITIPISKVSIYAGRTGDMVTRYEKTIKTLLAGAWLSREGNLGIAVTNISDEEAEICFLVDAGKYGIPASGSVSLISSEGKKSLGQYSDHGEVKCSVPARSNYVIELSK